MPIPSPLQPCPEHRHSNESDVTTAMAHGPWPMAHGSRGRTLPRPGPGDATPGSTWRDQLTHAARWRDQLTPVPSTLPLNWMHGSPCALGTASSAESPDHSQNPSPRPRSGEREELQPGTLPRTQQLSHLPPMGHRTSAIGHRPWSQAAALSSPTPFGQSVRSVGSVSRFGQSVRSVRSVSPSPVLAQGEGGERAGRW